MNIKFNTIQAILFGLVLVFLVLLIPLFFIERSSPATNIIGDIVLFLMGTLMMYTGYLMSERLENGKVLWYKQPFVIAGILVYILILLFWITSTFFGAFAR